MHFTPLGDRALLIHLGSAIDEATHRLVRAVCARLAEEPVPGMIELVPAFASVTVHYEPTRVPNGDREASCYERFAAAVDEALHDLDAGELPPPRSIEVPVVYGGEYGPDLEGVAQQHGLAADDVVRLHTGATYRVYMLGFAPGFPYMGGLPDAIATPRRAEPRTAVPAGTVGIGGTQTGIYPLTSPGGWQLIGRTPLRLFDPQNNPPALLPAGTKVRFRPISREEFDRWTK